MMRITFAPLIADQPFYGIGFRLEDEHAGYIGQDCNGKHFVYFYRPFWQNTGLRMARGYRFVSTHEEALALVKGLTTRLTYQRLMSHARSHRRSGSFNPLYECVLTDSARQRYLSYVHFDFGSLYRCRATAFPLALGVRNPSPISDAFPPQRAFFLPKAISRSLLNAHRSNAVPKTTTTRNTQ